MKTKVQEIQGEPCKFCVQSRNDPAKSYLVDLKAHNGNGACNCMDFVCTRSQLLRDGCEPSPKTRCWHIECARDYAIKMWGLFD